MHQEPAVLRMQAFPMEQHSLQLSQAVLFLNKENTGERKNTKPKQWTNNRAE